MTTRAEHLAGLQTRLIGRTSVGQEVHASRVIHLPDSRLPAICLYAPDETGDPVGAGHPQYRPSFTFAVEVRVRHRDGFDADAGAIVEEVKGLLFTDTTWTSLWKGIPRYRVRQYLDRSGADAFCGEVLTIEVEARRPTEYRPTAPTLSGLDVTVEDATGATRLAVSLDTPPE